MLVSILRKFRRHMQFYLMPKNENSTILMVMLVLTEDTAAKIFSVERVSTLKIFLVDLEEADLILFLNLFLEGEEDLVDLEEADLAEKEDLILFMKPQLL